MNKWKLSVLLLTAIFLIGCGFGSLGISSSPPEVKLNVNGKMMDGFQGPYCWDQGIAGTVCANPALFAKQPVFPELHPANITISKKNSANKVFKTTPMTASHTRLSL